MTAGSSFSNFVTDGNVRQDAMTFNPKLYSNVGAIKGYPGPANSPLAAAGDFGGKIMMKAGRRPAAGPDYHSFEDSEHLRSGEFRKGYAPVKSCNNNQCGGRKMKRGMRKTKRGMRKMKKGSHAMKRGMRKTKQGVRKMKKGKRTMKRGMRKAKRSVKKSMRKPLSMLEDVRDLFRMKGGEPAEVPKGSSSNGYHQYMGNQAHSNIYGLDGNLSPSENALANPMKIKVQNACAK